MTEEVDLEPDEHVAGLMALTEGEPDLVKLCGFLGCEVQDGCVRLYADAALSSWIDLHRDDIVRRDRVIAEDGTVGGRSEVYVKGEAMRRPLRRMPAADGLEAEFLSASPDIEELVPQVTLLDVAQGATLITDVSIACLTFRTCRI
jgi:hypothetical protein